MKTYIANTDYTVIDRSPLSLAKGDVVKIGKPDKGWPGWIWVSTEDGRGSYVPVEIVAKGKEGKGTVQAAFQAKDLSVSKGEKVESLREVKGWHWCRKANGDEGWLPEYLLIAVL